MACPARGAAQGNRADPDLHLALGWVTVAYHTKTTSFVLAIGVLGNESLRFGSAGQ